MNLQAVSTETIRFSVDTAFIKNIYFKPLLNNYLHFLTFKRYL